MDIFKDNRLIHVLNTPFLSHTGIFFSMSHQRSNKIYFLFGIGHMTKMTKNSCFMMTLDKSCVILGIRISCHTFAWFAFVKKLINSILLHMNFNFRSLITLFVCLPFYSSTHPPTYQRFQFNEQLNEHHYTTQSCQNIIFHFQTVVAHWKFINHVTIVKNHLKLVHL